MKNLKLALLFTVILFCSNTFVQTFAQTKDQDGDGVLVKYDAYPSEKETAKNKVYTENNTAIIKKTEEIKIVGNKSNKPIVKEIFDLKEDFIKIVEDAEKDFSTQIAEKILDENRMQHFKYKTTLGGVEEVVLKTSNEDKTINTIYFRSKFYLTNEEEKTKANEIKKIFLEVAGGYEKNRGCQVYAEVDAMKNNKTILKDKLGHQLVLFVEKPNNAGVTIYIYGKSANKK